jgi:ribose transport system ATP-binding protein
MLRIENITKKFSGVTALDNVSMQIEEGKVIAIIGGNGAGKSTLMKILSGVYITYEGKIFLHNKQVHFNTTAEAQKNGIAIIHQELNIIPHLSIAENIFLGNELLNHFGFLDKQKMQEKAKSLLSMLGLALEPNTIVQTLKVGQQQMVEIAKALLVDASLLIMDEPTSAITTAEVESLFAVIRQLKSEGKTIVYISHKLNELYSIADNYIVLRDGKTIDAGLIQNISQNELIQKMIGNEMLTMQSVSNVVDGKEILRIENLNLEIQHKQILRNINFTLKSGEVLGIFGLMGAGRTELLESLFGLHCKNIKGNIFIHNKLVLIKSPANAIQLGIALLPEDRKKDGLVLGMTVKENIALPLHNGAGIFISSNKETAIAKKYIVQLDIKTNNENTKVNNLSGGNQQKIVLAKWLEGNPEILLLDEPTRGIDVNAKNEMYKTIKLFAAKGMAVIVVSSELSEIMTISDRIMVMAEGAITATIPFEKATEAIVLKAAINNN